MVSPCHWDPLTQLRAPPSFTHSSRESMLVLLAGVGCNPHRQPNSTCHTAQRGQLCWLAHTSQHTEAQYRTECPAYLGAVCAATAATNAPAASAPVAAPTLYLCAGYAKRKRRSSSVSRPNASASRPAAAAAAEVTTAAAAATPCEQVKTVCTA